MYDTALNRIKKLSLEKMRKNDFEKHVWNIFKTFLLEFSQKIICIPFTGEFKDEQKQKYHEPK